MAKLIKGTNTSAPSGLRNTARSNFSILSAKWVLSIPSIKLSEREAAHVEVNTVPQIF